MAKPLILIIEDDTNLSEAMTEVLSDLGCRVIRTECSEEGLRLAAERQPDLVLCDVMLPDGQGYVVNIGAAWSDFPGESIEDDTRRMNAFIESEVPRLPEQYFWLHKRFKTRPPGEPSPYEKKRD